jgi:hypothetical protein
LQVRLPVGLVGTLNDDLVAVGASLVASAISLADGLAVTTLLASSLISPTARLLLITGVGVAAAGLLAAEAAEVFPVAEAAAAVSDLAAPTGVGAAKEDEAADTEGTEAVIVSSGTSTSPSLSIASVKISVLPSYLQ